jgi:hypothetical protein
MERAEVLHFKNLSDLCFRAKSAVAFPALIRFLAGKAGFGMTRAEMAGLTRQAAIS